MFKYTDKPQLWYLVYIYSVTLQSIAKRSSQAAKKLFGEQCGRKSTFIYTWCSIYKRNMLVTTSKFQNFPGH